MDRTGLLLLGLATGFCSAALGIGGGVIMVPCLVLLLGSKMKKAVGTSLATIIPTALVGIATHYILNAENIKGVVALPIIIGSLAGSYLGAWLVERMQGNSLRTLFSLLLIFTGLEMAGLVNLPTESVSSLTSGPLLALLGLIAGIASALFGIGGGIIMVPAMTLFFGLSMHEAVATSLVALLPTTVAGALFHRKFGNIDSSAIRFLIPTALIGAALGAVFANSMPAPVLERMFGILLLVASVKLFLQKE